MRSTSLAVLFTAASSTTTLLTGCTDRPSESPSVADSRPISLTVDTTDPAHSLFHAHLVIPAHAGVMTLAYPQWIPGEHMPTGAVVNVVDLHITAAGKTVAWRRDLEKMFEIAVTVPEGAASLEVDFDYVNAIGPVTSLGNASSTHALVLEWNRVVMYPKGAKVSSIPVDAHLKLPAGWSYATALATRSDASKSGGTIDFRQVSLETLVDSPLLAGQYHRTFDLGNPHGAHHTVEVVAESAEALEVPPEVVQGWKNLVIEATALFGARHYDSYRFLMPLSDGIEAGRSGLEHHQSSLDGLGERNYLDEDKRRANSDLLPHEYAHSWDGKYRRPRGLATPDYQTPMHDELLWVYEGLTEYLGTILTARSGLGTAAEAEQNVALFADYLKNVGRDWRPVIDTAIASQLLRETPTRGSSRRRHQDYYVEGALVWLEADVIIRQRSHGTRSLDDFCQRFFGGKDSGAEVRPYDLEEVLSTLNGVQAYDWRAFFDARIYQVATQVPLNGIEGSGYRLAYVDKETDMVKSYEAADEYATYSSSLGFSVDDDGNKLGEVRAGSPADRAGLLSGAKLVAVDGRKYSKQVMKDALERARTTKEPIELLVSADDFYRTVKVDWHGGERYATLERDPSRPDLLAKILAPRVVKLGGAK